MQHLQEECVSYLALYKIAVSLPINSCRFDDTILSMLSCSTPSLDIAGCDYVSVERVNKQQLNPLLSRLVKTPFFRYFKVNLWCDCSFWPDDSMCMLRDCSVCECDDSEIPSVWKAAEGKCKGETQCLFQHF